MTLNDVFERLKPMAGEFIMDAKGEIRHRSRFTGGGSPCCPLACLVDEPTNDPLSLSELLGLERQEAIEFTIAADESPGRGAGLLRWELLPLRLRLLKTLGLVELQEPS